MKSLAFAFLLVACGGQVESFEETEAEPFCHQVRGYFADNRCSERLEFDSCAPPDYAWTVQDFQCRQVQP